MKVVTYKKLKHIEAKEEKPQSRPRTEMVIDLGLGEETNRNPPCVLPEPRVSRAS